jgi:hypothetical protein
MANRKGSALIHRIVPVLLIGVAALVGAWDLAAAQSEGPSSAGTDPICPARLHLRHPGLCSLQGSQEEVIERAITGVDPVRPLPVTGLDPALGNVPFDYIRSKRDDGTPLYTSVDAAFSKGDAYRTIEPGFVFFSWIEKYRNSEGKEVYMIDPGVYVRSSGVSPLSMPTFHGFELASTPDRPFGWILQGTETRAGAGFDQPATGRWFNRFDLVTIFERIEVGQGVWYKIGPEDWVMDHMLAIVYPDTSVPEGVQDNRWLTINLYEQTIAAYENGEMIFATMVSSGLDGWWTQPGVFQVYKKLEADPMQGAFAADRSDYYYLEDVPWILYYDKARAIHGAYWHNGYGYPRSHGCVNVSPADAHWIYNWAQEGTWVYVFDPTGRTPTDPQVYTDGGA